MRRAPLVICCGACCVAWSGCLDFDALDGEPAYCLHAVRGGWTHTCARMLDNTAWCWGHNNAGQLGVPGETESQPTPTRVGGVSRLVELAVGDSFSCGVGQEGGVTCWGYNDYHQLGPRDDAIGLPGEVARLTDARHVAAGAEHACAVKADETVVCWGRNHRGQLGAGSTGYQQPEPSAVGGISDVVQLALGFTHSCALKRDGTVWCWGGNASGQLGDGTKEDRATASRRAMIDDVVQIGAALHHSCAVKRDGTVWCWGLNNRGQLGDGSVVDSPRPVRALSVADVVQVALGGYETNGPVSHTCARGGDGRVWCWGANAFGQLGDGTSTSRDEPTPVPGLEDALDVGAGATHSCAVRGGGGVWCWGANDRGQLGDGTVGPPRTAAPALLGCSSWAPAD